jgi:hypothetical protein
MPSAETHRAERPPARAWGEAVEEVVRRAAECHETWSWLMGWKAARQRVVPAVDSGTDERVERNRWAAVPEAELREEPTEAEQGGPERPRSR